MSKNTLSKADLVEAVATATGQTKKDVTSIVSSILETITDNVAKGNAINIIGFGKFSSSKRAERTGRNPSSGEQITIPEAMLPKFSAGKAFKDKVNK